MNKNTLARFGMIAIIFGLCSFTVLAQGPLGAVPPGPPPPSGAEGVVTGPALDIVRALRLVAGYLDLSEDQAAQVREILRTSADEIHALRDQCRDLEAALRDELNAEEPSVETAGQLTIEIHGIRQAIAAASAEALESIRSLLTEEQLAKVEAVRLAARLEPVVNAFKALGLLPPPHPPIPGENDPV
jgi:Spy/CpxP family protein refolding chaperone